MIVLGLHTGQYWLVFDGTGSLWGDTGCNLVVLGQYNLILIGIEWYWVNKTISDGGITVDFWVIKVHTSN